MTAATAPSVSLDQVMSAAFEHQRRGALTEARRLYEKVLARIPFHPTALTMLASIAYRQGDDALGDVYVERAIRAYRGILEAEPVNPGAAAGLANLLLARGRAAEAEACLAAADLPLNPVRSSAEDFERRRADACRRGLPGMLISTIPKSASESIWNRIAEGLALAQSHVSVGLFPHCALVPARARARAAGGLIAKEHILPTRWNLEVLEDAGLERLVVHVRDPRQATLSWAHFVRDDVAGRPLAPIWRRVVPRRRILEGGFDSLLDWCLEHYLPLLVRFIAAWRQMEWPAAGRPRVLCLCFEQFRTEPERYLERFLEHYGIPWRDFAAERQAEVVHLRKGSIDEWRDVFSRTQRRRAWRALPRELARVFAWQP